MNVIITDIIIILKAPNIKTPMNKNMIFRHYYYKKLTITQRMILVLIGFVDIITYCWFKIVDVDATIFWFVDSWWFCILILLQWIFYAMQWTFARL